MKVAFLAKAHFDTSVPLLKELSKLVEIEFIIVTGGARHSESIFDFDLRNIPYGFINDRETVIGLVGNEIMEEFGYAMDISLFHFPSWRFRSLYNVKLAFQLINYMKKKRFDIIHYNGIFGMFHILYDLFTQRIPKVQTIHDSSPHKGEATLQFYINRYHITFNGSEIIFASRFSANDFLSKNPISKDRVHVIPFGPLTVYTLFNNHFEIEPNPNEILFFGRIFPYKGIEYLIEAYKKVKGRIADASLVIAGSGDIYFRTNHIENDQSIFIDNRYIPNTLLAKYLKRCAVIALPYTDATQSGVVMMAYAFQKPVIATRVGGLPEFVRHGETGLLVPACDSDSLAEALMNILEDEAYRKQIVNNIIDYCENEFSWKNIARRTYEVYQKKACP